MSETIRFPDYIERDEEHQILREADLVKKDRQSRAVMLYGAGGVGKTWLVRELARKANDEQVVWLEPMDIDDSEYWLLYNLEQRVAHRLDPGNRYFKPYRDYVARIPQYARPATGSAAILSHLGRIKDVFLDCYRGFAQETGRTVVVTLDTVEAIRGTYLLLTLTRWMKALPGTLFVLSGRPTSAEIQDPIKRELDSGQNRLHVLRVDLAGFTKETALGYLNESGAARALSGEEKDKMIHLTRGHPLWLAFALDFLMEMGLPEEAERPLAKITAAMPYQEQMTAKGRMLHDAFKRRLVTQYRSGQFWQEAIKRLAVVRERVSQPIWQRLMDDLQLPPDIGDWDEAWRLLLEIPWVRPRSNRRYVTLHDAVAEELAMRIIPVHDQNQQWRRGLWQRAIDVYGDLIETVEADVSQRLVDVPAEHDGTGAPELDTAALEEIAKLDADKRELDQLRVSRLYYRLLSDPEEACREFRTLFDQASRQHDVLFRELIVLEMQRFLSTGGHPHDLGDVTHGAIDLFQAWLTSNPESYLDLIVTMAEYLIENEQSESAMDLLDSPWPVDAASPAQRYRLNLQMGNACMRTPGRVKDGEHYFRQALDDASTFGSEHEQRRAVAKAYNELGFYYRSVGRWESADDAYFRAHDELLSIFSIASPAEDREQMASIQNNWAFVKALRGRHREARELVESAIAARHRLGRRLQEGISWGVAGAVSRYDEKFRTAWGCFRKAEEIFDDLKNWPWLGAVYQQQAICLYDAAAEAGVDLLEGEGRDPYERAEVLIALAIDICRDKRVRNYPSALFRAGRIYGQKDPDKALGYLDEGIVQASRLLDGWFWFASLIEYVEISYQAWVKTGRPEYRERISKRSMEIEQIMLEYQFSHLRGRWQILQGHLQLREALATKEESTLGDALRHYKEGFPQITGGYIGSYGWGSIPAAFGTFAELFRNLSDRTKEGWINELRAAWKDKTSLMAHLPGLC